MKQPIVDYHQDEQGDWVADLACGHGQHVRHQPPFVNRPWSEGTGDVRVGLKIKFLDDYALDPVAFAIRGFAKIPTADDGA